MDLVDEVRDNKNHQNFLLRDLFYVANKFTISSAFRTLIPSKTTGLYAFVEEIEYNRGGLDFIIRYIGRTDDIQKRLLQHEKEINNVLEKIREGKDEKGKYFQFAKKILENPKSYTIYIWRWKNPRPIHDFVFSGEDIDLVDAEGLIGGILGEVFGEECYNREFISTSLWALETPNMNFLRIETKPFKNDNISLLERWRKWCKEYIIHRNVPLFYVDRETNQLFTLENENGETRILRHPFMEDMVAEEVSKVYNSFTQNNSDFEYDGLVYIVYTYLDLLKEHVNSENEIVPLYIGKTETIGVNGKYSVNIKNVHKKLNKTKFARWGDGTAYHIGDLSDALFENRKSENFNKYKKWAEFFFEERSIKSNKPVILKFPIYFWIKAWKKEDKGFILDLPCSSCFLERQLISISNNLFMQFTLNTK